MSIDAEEAAIRTVIVGALMGHSEAGERGFDALFAIRQAEAIVKALKSSKDFSAHSVEACPASSLSLAARAHRRRANTLK